MGEAAQRLRRGIALPDEIDMAEADIDRRALEDLGRDVVQHAIAHVDRVVEAEQPARRFELVREIFEHALAADAGLRVFAGRIGRHALVGAFAIDGHERIDAAGGERDDARGREGLRHQRRHVRVHRPGQRQIALRAELASGHEDDVGELAAGGGSRIRPADRNAMVSMPRACSHSLDAGLAEARHADDAACRAGRLSPGRAKVGPILPPTPSTMMSPSTCLEVVDQRLARPAQQLVECGDVRDGLRQGVARAALSVLIAA